MANSSVAAKLEELSTQQLTDMSAEQLLEALGGVAEVGIVEDGFVKPHFREAVAKMPKVPLMIPTPDTWQAPFPFVQKFCINSMTFEVTGDQLTMVPQVVFEVWRNKVDLEALGRAHKRAAQKRMGYTNIAEVPHY